MIPYKQLSLADIYSDCQEKFVNDKYKFLSFLESNIDINKFISISLRNHYHTSTGRPRKYPHPLGLYLKSTGFYSCTLFAIIQVWLSACAERG